MCRLGNCLLLLGSGVLAGLMLYTLVFVPASPGSWSPWGTPREAAEVAVVVPDRQTWCEFRQAVNACEGKKLARVVARDEDAVLVETPKYGRVVRFTWHEVRGFLETRNKVPQITGQNPRPVAVVGSNNTALTVALARALRDGGRERAGRGAGPLLLVPWATTVLTEGQGPGPVAFLDLYHGRTFRFCPNNESQADLVVRCLADHEPGVTLKRAEIVVDPNDPYSGDLADGFQRVLKRRFPGASLIRHADGLTVPRLTGLPAVPSDSEDALAARTCRDAGGLGPKEVMWVVLPLQQEPALRMLAALQRHARPEWRDRGSPLRVVCGDGIVPETLFRLLGKFPAPVWCFFARLPPAAGGSPGSVLATDAQTLAEIVAALVLSLDVPRAEGDATDALSDALSALKIPADSPAAFGRSLAFYPSGERQGDDLGHVLSITPGGPAVTAWVRTPAGGWVTTPLAPPTAVPNWP